MKNILFIAKMSLFEDEISPNRFYFLNYLANKPNIKILDDNPSNNLSSWLEEHKSSFKPDIIVYYFLTRLQHLLKIELEDFDSARQKYRIPSIMVFEDSHYTKLVNAAYKYYKFEYFIHLNKNSNVISRLNQYNIPVYTWNQYIDVSKFNSNNVSQEKEYDFLFYGMVNEEVYPLRFKLYNALKELQETHKDIRIKIIEHGGEYNKNLNPLPCQEELSKLIGKSRFSFSTSSMYDLFVKKYVEIPLSGATLIGNIPSNYEDLLNNNIIIVNKHMSLPSIKERLINAYEGKYIHIENNLKTFADKLKKIYNYNSGYHDLNFMIEYILRYLHSPIKINQMPFKKMNMVPFNPSNIKKNSNYAKRNFMFKFK